jgi:uncharacterized protein
MFGVFLTVAVTLLQIYVFWRIISMPALQRDGTRKTFYAAGLALWAVFLAGRLYGHGGSSRLAVALESVGMIWMVVLFLIAVCFLVVDAVTGFGAFFPRAVQRMRSAALAAGLLMSVIAFIQGHRAPVIESFFVTIPGLPTELEGKTLVALADLHFGATLGDVWLAARVRQVMAERPDLVVLLGDVVEGDSEFDEKFASSLSGLSAPLGVWGVLGNHESHGPAGKNAGHLAEAGVHVLRSERTEIRPDFFLAGVNDVTSGEKNGRMIAELNKTLQGLPTGAATILLSHAPVGADFAAAHGVSLMLSGHTHGGQIWPFSYIVGLRYPMRDGRYTVGGMTVIVCRGTGTWATRMRLWSPSSILRITLHRG